MYLFHSFLSYGAFPPLSLTDKTEHGHRRVTSIELRRDNGSTYVLEDELSDGTGTVEDIRYNWLPMCGCGDVMFAPILALTLRISASGNDSLFTDIKHNTMDVAETSSHERRYARYMRNGVILDVNGVTSVHLSCSTQTAMDSR